MKGLVIDDPWISLILAGKKDWEMRTTATTYRGDVALIRKGSGRIVGSCTLEDSFGPLDAIAWRAHRSRHGIPEAQDSAQERWPFAWVLANVRPFARSVPYTHPPGAVIWVNLNQSVIDACRVASLGPAAAIPLPVASSAPPPRIAIQDTPIAVPVNGEVPVAGDGSWFGPHLRRSSGFTIGRKGEERVVVSYLDALAQLKAMPKAYWRRPNAGGNWGIVTAVRWNERPDSTRT